MKIPTVQETLNLDVVEYPDYFVGYIANLSIETMPYTDECYHDAPFSITIGMSIDDMIYLRDKLNEGIKQAKQIHKKYKNRVIKEK